MAARRAALRCLHQRGTIPSAPTAKPNPKAARTTNTWGARHCVPKKKCTVASCWLFSAKAKSVKKRAALSVHLSRLASCFMVSPGVPSILALHLRGQAAAGCAKPGPNPTGVQALRCSLSWGVCLSTVSRRALPGLKCSTRLSGMATLSPLRGLRPWRGSR